MKTLLALLADFGRDQRGATAIEYGFIAALMSVATIATITQIGGNVGELTGRVMGGLK
ncbi:MAG: Flp family type IVb pilin [Bosea sp. (in: a-proteobacteria)]|jgi:pilus assembly protein Flp/PilA|uniref:Flp family type IVb pilin n=1 Tax=unclassified Bosea (in: a-proteobacteria) TaxID=2653178 RepID=UPI00085783C3|nr:MULTISPECIES: Flp family type IVb pilin [unclassified Bosea (in: a-proteobacteria)]MBA4269048.1 Flp family type IVb pilin [Methylobacterium sp.]AOG03861.1 flp/Fap pilin component family protein [Bosea sp. RAC05]MBA4335445.1 Flp family type IVb pilin [Methylobacterium sp.]MDP3600617.1 Flp family type IVb pilin [Bosea sp. (in: a-proteobacteria)]WRH57898.1 MAG: Flp family type IVb pilin [Bosea sp. (in: a-proteobacteria)]